MQTLAADHVA